MVGTWQQAITGTARDATRDPLGSCSKPLCSPHASAAQVKYTNSSAEETKALRCLRILPISSHLLAQAWLLHEASVIRATSPEVLALPVHGPSAARKNGQLTSISGVSGKCVHRDSVIEQKLSIQPAFGAARSQLCFPALHCF